MNQKKKFNREALEIRLEDVIEFVEENRKKGVECPCCSQYAKEYKRPVNLTMVETLQAFAAYIGDGDRSVYHNAVDVSNQCEIPRLKRNGFGGDFAKFVHYGILEQMPAERGKNSRHWRIGSEGWLFLEGKLAIPKFHHIYDNRLLGLSGPNMFIHEFKNRFDFREVMAG